MNPRLQRHVRTVATVVGISGLVGAVYALAQGHVSLELIVTSALHGVGISFALTMFEIAVDQHPLRDWVARLSFTVTLILRSLVYVLVIVVVHVAIMYVRQILGIGTGRAYDALLDTIIFSSAAALAINFVIQIANLLGPAR